MIHLSTIILSFSYAVIRPHYIEKYLKQNLEQGVIETETVKKVIPLILAWVIGFAIVAFIAPHDTSFYDFMSLSVGLIGIASLLMYGLTISKKEFRFYFAKTCLVTALNNKNIFKQMHYFILGLQGYNNYLKRNLKCQIKDIDKILSKMSLLQNDERAKKICLLSNSSKMESDGLEPLRSISTELMKSEDIESVLTSESLKSQLKPVAVFLAASIPIVISIITLLDKLGII